MDDTTKKMLVTVGAGAIRKVLMLQAAGLVSHGLLNSNMTETFVSLGMAGVGAAWSLWNDFGRAIVLSHLEVWKAKSLAQAAALKSAGIAPPTAHEVAAHSPSLTSADVVKAGAAICLAVMVVLASAASPALAQVKRPVVAVPAPAPAPITLPTLSSYLFGKPHILKIPNPLGLPDPACITDHPTGTNCATDNGGAGSGIQLTGDPGKDLTTLFTKGGKALVRDMQRADQYLSAPTVPGCTTNCAKVDQLSSACLEAVLPVAQMVINGPPVSATAPAIPGVDAPDPALTAADEGVVTQGAKLDIILLALNGPNLQQGCGGWVFAKLKNVQNLSSGIVTFITTMATPAAAAAVAAL